MTPQPTIIYAVVGLLGFIAAARAQEVTLVAPPGFEDREGNAVANPTGPGSVDGGPDGIRLQMLYLAEYFSPAGPGPFVITGWAGRPDVSVDEPVSAEYEYTVNLTTTEVDSLTSSFVGNYGSSGIATTVFSGMVQEETDGVPRSGGLPHDFDYVIEFETPYVYDPSEGNLLFEQISPTNYTTRPIWRDFHEFGSGPNLFAFNDNPASLFAQFTGQVNQIAQFTFVPEPMFGDVNGDGQVNGLDVDPFVEVLLSGPYQTEADMNEDQVVNGLDVDPFVAAVVGGGVAAVPEPSALLLALAALGILGAWRRKRCQILGETVVEGPQQPPRDLFPRAPWWHSPTWRKNTAKHSRFST
jgi:MYXO-CTERM domain-containing protein